MTTTIPTNEPDQLRAGDTWQWRREDLTADYPAGDGWVLTYRFKNAAGGFEIVAEADGDNFAIEASAASTEDFTAGTYRWQAQVVLGAVKKTVDTGTFVVQPGLFIDGDETALDQRTHARKVLDAIEAVLESRASKDQQEYSIAGRSLKRTPIADLIMMRDRYAAEVRSQDAADRTANGLPDKRRVYVRFHRV